MSTQGAYPSAGEVIDGKYQVIGKLGQGEVGVVYKARALDLRPHICGGRRCHGDRSGNARRGA